MAGRFRSEHGADSACTACQSSTPHAFRVKMWADDGGPFDLLVPAAIGPADARSQARYTADEAGHYEASPVRVEHAA